MLTTSTHDTKRSEDVRARLAVLSEVPDRYLDALDRFAAVLDRSPAAGLDPLATTTIFQAMVGAHPLPAGRLDVYVQKALREAGVRTSWLAVDDDYEQRVHEAIRHVTSDPDAPAIVDELVAEILVDGRRSSLAHRLVLLTAPGVPDLYQGSELWDLSLVDPDNRRPTDLADRHHRLRAGGWSDPAIEVPGWQEVQDADDPGTPKLALTARALAVRRAHPAAFEPGASYRPLEVTGEALDHVVAFQRGDDVVVVVPRLGRTARDRGGWGATAVTLPDGAWRDALTPDRCLERSVEIARLLERVPVALLVRSS